MNKKLKLQDFTFLINIIKDQDNWNIQDLADKLTVDLDTLLYMLNIMSEVYSVNGESFINFDLDLSKNNITFDYSIELKDLETITDFELFKIYNILISQDKIFIKNINKNDLSFLTDTLEIFFDEKSNINQDNYLSIFLENEVNIEYIKLGRKNPGIYSIKPLSISNNADGNVLEAIDLVDNKIKTFLVNRILSVGDLDLNKSTKEDKTKNIEVKFNIYSEKSISKLNKDKIKMSNEIYIYIFRDYYVAMEFFLENFKDVEILSPENLKNEFDEKINKLRIMVSK
uniref:MedDCM-OCT-S25-C81-cds7 n=1 Tax=Candidatus Actinomarina minuta TaxID=1389454 RepID=S5DJ21_9ACTN|nr:MedDCM-OCT-S25-C81-cds7 [Candidatus Actinomarina minuta]